RDRMPGEVASGHSDDAVQREELDDLAWGRWQVAQLEHGPALDEAVAGVDDDLDPGRVDEPQPRAVDHEVAAARVEDIVERVGHDAGSAGVEVTDHRHRRPRRRVRAGRDRDGEPLLVGPHAGTLRDSALNDSNRLKSSLSVHTVVTGAFVPPFDDEVVTLGPEVGRLGDVDPEE